MKKIYSNMLLAFIAFILFWCGYFVGYTQYKRNIENETKKVKSEVININTTTEENETPIGTIYYDTVKHDYYDTLKYTYYRFKFVGTGKRQYIMCYPVDSVTWKQVTIEY